MIKRAHKLVLGALGVRSLAAVVGVPALEDLRTSYVEEWFSEQFGE